MQSCALDPGGVASDVWRHANKLTQAATAALYAPPEGKPSPGGVVGGGGCRRGRQGVIVVPHLLAGPAAKQCSAESHPPRHAFAPAHTWAHPSLCGCTGGAEIVLHAAVAPWSGAGDRVGDGGRGELRPEEDLRVGWQGMRTKNGGQEEQGSG